MKNILLVLFVIIILSGLLGIIFITLPNDSLDIPEDTNQSEGQIIVFSNITSYDKNINSFALNIFKQFKERYPQENIVFSPYSIFTALSMMYEGAIGETADEMKAVLQINQNNESYHVYVETVNEYLNNNQKYNISAANSLWIKQNFSLLSD